MKTSLSRVTKFISVFALVLLATVWVGKGNLFVEASDLGYISTLSQTDAQKHSLTVTWTPAENATAYNVYYKEYAADGDYQFVGKTAGTSFTLSNLKAATQYDVKVEPTDGVETEYAKGLYGAVTLPDKMEGLKQKQWWFFIKELDIEWTRQDAADGYEVILYDNKGKKVNAQTPGGYSTSVSFSNMKDKVYSVKARSYMTYNGQMYYSSWSEIYCLNQARIKKINVKSNKLNISWGKIAGATGYRVYVSNNAKGGYKKVATLGKNKSSYSLKKFKGKKISSKKTYYVYVETVCNKKGSKNSSGGLYYWSSKGGYGYVK